MLSIWCFEVYLMQLINNGMQYNDHAQRCWESSCVCRTNSYDWRMNSYASRATIARHSQHLSDMCLSPKSLLISYVVRTAAVRIRTTAVRIRTAAVLSKQIASRSQGKWACRNPPFDVAIDRTALRIHTTAVRSLSNSLRFQSQAIARLSYSWCKQVFIELTFNPYWHPYRNQNCHIMKTYTYI